jgi:AMP-binding enzyme
LQLDRFLGWRIHPGVDLLSRRQNDGHRFRVDRRDLLVRLGRQKICGFAFLHLPDGGPARPDARKANGRVTKPADDWRTITGTEVVEGYGLTESSPVLTCNPAARAKPGSIGVPLPLTEMKCVDDQGNEVAIGEAGEIIARGPQIMPGYWRQPGETGKVLRDGWLFTGDIGKMAPDIASYFCFRQKYLRGGPGAAWLYVHPRHLEGPLRTLDTGWFATPEPFAFYRPELPSFAPGAEGWLESTPAVLPYYQARGGLEFTLAMGVEGLRAYSLLQQANLVDRLAEQGIAILGAGLPHGAFIAISTPKAEAAATRC